MFGKQTIAIQEQLGDQWSRILGWRERFILRGLRCSGTASYSQYHEKNSDPKVGSKYGLFFCCFQLLSHWAYILSLTFIIFGQCWYFRFCHGRRFLEFPSSPNKVDSGDDQQG